MSVINSISTNAKLYETCIILQDKQEVEVEVLIDTGDFVADLISSQLVQHLPFDTSTCSTVSFPFPHIPNLKTIGSLEFQLKIKNDLTSQMEFLPIRALVIENMFLDVIIGRHTYEQYNLHDKLRSHFTNSKLPYPNPYIATLLSTLVNSEELIGEVTAEDYEFPPTDSSVYDLRDPFEIQPNELIENEFFNQSNLVDPNLFKLR